MKKIKIIAIVAIVLLVAVAALVTSFAFSRSRGLLGGMASQNPQSAGDMGLDMPEMGGGMLKERSAITRPNSTGMSKDSYSGEAPVAVPEGDRKIMKNGDLNIKVDRLSDAQEEISRIAKDNGGSVFSSNIYQTRANIKSGVITVKVPVANFEKTFNEIKNIAALVIRESTSGNDVTMEYQDLETRIKNLQDEEQSYRNILATAQKVSDILEITQSVSRVRGQIESYQGQLKFMAAQTDMSTISVSLSEDQDITVTDSWRPLQIAKDAINELVKLVQGFISFLIVLVITFIPVAFLYILAIYVIYFVGKVIYRKFRKKKEDAPIAN